MEEVTPPNVEQRDQSLRQMINLYIQFARMVSEKTGKSLEETLLSYAPLYNRFQDYAPDPDKKVWNEYISGIGDMPLEEWTYRFYTERHKAGEEMQAKKRTEMRDGPRTSCFSYEVEGDTVYIHFTNKDRSGEGPLSEARRAERMKELKELFMIIKARRPEVTRVCGGSWLYNIDAYRRLFPESYIQSARPNENETFSGMGIWGQFLDSERNVKQELVDQFLKKVPETDVAHLPEAFPYQLLKTEAPIQDFYKKYGIE